MNLKLSAFQQRWLRARRIQVGYRWSPQQTWSLFSKTFRPSSFFSYMDGT